MNRHAVFFAAFGLAATLPVSAMAAGGAGADEAGAASSQLQMAMTIYAAGVTIGKVDMDATIRDDKYHVVSNLTTSGVVNAFWQSEIQASSSGTIRDKGIEPALYDSFDTNHSSKKQEVSLTYAPGSAPRLYAEPAYKTRGYEVPPEQQKNTFDPLSAVMFMTSGVAVSADNPCAVTAPVFDGRRRYNIELAKVKNTTISMDNGLYKGPAAVCSVKYRQLAGFKPNIIKQNEKFPPVQAWVAVFPSAVTGHHYVVPLKVWANTQYGLVAVVATSIKVDGSPPKAS
jgi:uncharacterized protein DUF3108